MRSLIYLAAMARSGPHGRLGVVAVEMAYVTLTAGLYAGMQQRALALRSRFLGNLIVVVGVPGLAQFFHLHVMRRGVFLTGHTGRTLADDFRRMPRLVLDFVLRPYTLFSGFSARVVRAAESEGAV